MSRKALVQKLWQKFFDYLSAKTIDQPYHKTKLIEINIR